jgi:hypothetical protein
MYKKVARINLSYTFILANPNINILITIDHYMTAIMQ